MELKNEINKLKRELNSKNEEMSNIKNELKQLKDELLLLKKNKTEKTNDFSIFKDSIILKEEADKNNLFFWISEKRKIKNISLIYRGTRDGDNYKAFYDRCSNVGPTLSLIKTKNGKKFGGFSFREWTDKKGILRLDDKEAFLFSLDNKKKYKILKSNLAICCYSDHSSFLTYGNNADSCGIYLNNLYLKAGGNENHHSRVYDVDSDFCFSGEKKFKVEDVEVFSVIFE